MARSIRFQTAQDSILAYAHLKGYKVRAKHDRIIIYGPIGAAIEMMGNMSEWGSQKPGLGKPMYEAVMRFIFEPIDSVYFLERKHYHGEGGWLSLDMGTDLAPLCKRYLKHIGKESFYDLI